MHYIRSWSKTQATVALSSAEAELQGMVKAGAESIGVESMMSDLGMHPGGKSVVYADASAALGVAARRGAGKIRHLDVRILWVQEKGIRERMSFEKVLGADNTADGLIKYVAKENLEKMVKALVMYWRSGRASIAPKAGSN
jgi:hypothetical protein